jgi:hypothetical protein
MKRSEEDMAEKVREARMRWYGHVIRKDEGKLARDIMECFKRSEEDVRW